jgi:hypothetical protein
MKQCPKCQFIYTDSDTICDLDGTSLVEVNERDLTLTPIAPRSYLRVVRIVAAVVAIIAGLAVVLIYYGIRQRRQNSAQLPTTVSPAVSPTPTGLPQSTPAISTSPELAETPTQSPAAPAAITKNPVSKNPVSTSGNEVRGRAVLILQNGSRIEADEVWRTRQGIWYRRNGLVTLIQPSRVKSIQKLN